MTACGAIVLTLPTFVGLLSLFIWVISAGGNNNNNNNNNQNNGEYRPWWDYFDMDDEEMQSVKLIMNLVVLIIACGTLFVPINKAHSGVYERFNVGVLASSMFMFGNMLFVSFWYLANFGRREEEDNNNNNNNNGYYNNNNRYWMDEREVVAYNQKIVSWVLLGLGVAYFIVAAGIYGAGEALPQTLHTTNEQTQVHLLAAGRFQALGQTWSVLSLSNIIVFVGLFIATFLLFVGGEDVERMVEEARIVNLFIVLLHMGILTIVMLFKGNEIFSEQRSGSLGVGMAYGGAKYFSGLLFMVCILFGNFSFDEREREEGVWVTTATSIASIILSVLHLMFSMKARSYQTYIYDANAEHDNMEIVEAQNGIVHGATGPFVRVD